MKVVLITGASSGFGMLVAERLLAEGHAVYAAARRVERMAPLATKGAHLLGMDVTDTASVEAGVAQVLAEQGRIDVLFNNAGYGSYGAVECVPLEEVRRQYEVNVFGVGRLIQAVVPHMRQRRQGRVINMASVVGQISMPMLGWYASTKHAVEALSDALRMELGPLGIDVVVIEPGPVRTEFEATAFATFARVEHPEEYRARAAAFERFSHAMYARAPGPESTAAAVMKAIHARRPRARYATTAMAAILPRVRRWLGDRLFDWAMLGRLE